jgi:biopolymer transport protein ExbB/TolQ
VGRLADEAVHTLRRRGRAASMQRLAACGGVVAEALAGLVAACDGFHSRAQQDAALRHAEERLSAPEQYLQVLVRIAPLLGLLGTVYGMVETFGVLHLTGARDPRALSAGISTALLTTQAGLLIALPGLYGTEWLRRWEDRISMELNRVRYTLIGVGE